MGSFQLTCISFILFFSPVSLSTIFEFTNACSNPIWPAILSNSNSMPLSSTGFFLNINETWIIEAPSSWSGRMWARTLCTTDSATGSFSCITGDCGSRVIDCNGAGAVPPATLAEFTLNGDAGQDYYDVSLVDGFNLPVKVIPKDSENGSMCKSIGCTVDVNSKCPEALKLMHGNEVVGCKSACQAFGSANFCCSGDYASPNTCAPSEYSNFFKHECSTSYSYAFDDPTSTFTCPTGGSSYVIKFCSSNYSWRRQDQTRDDSENKSTTSSDDPDTQYATSKWSPTVFAASVVLFILIVSFGLICYFYIL